jgi:N-succinyldiaminopimelate aminotransferase
MSARARVSQSLAPFGTSIFTEMSALALEHRAVNLSQGFPDLDGPLALKRLAAEAILQGPNQYAPSPGTPELRQAVAAHLERFRGLRVDPEREVTVTAGATEGLAASLLGLLDPGDEVILLEPFYDLYPAMVARAGGRAVCVPPLPDGRGLDGDALARAFGPRTRAIVLNNPQNPSGKVYTRAELELVAGLCERHDAVAIGDEVYEHLTYEGREHVSLLSVPALQGRAIAISSGAKTFSMTGWKVGWVVGCPALSEAVRAAHQFLTFCTPAPLQRAVAVGLAYPDAFFLELERDYARRRELLCGGLEALGLPVRRPEGTYYATVRIHGLGLGDDLEACRRLTREAGVAAIPFSAFTCGRQRQRDLVRLCFCKQAETLGEALARLGRFFGQRARG